MDRDTTAKDQYMPQSHMILQLWTVQPEEATQIDCTCLKRGILESHVNPAHAAVLHQLTTWFPNILHLDCFRTTRSNPVRSMFRRQTASIEGFESGQPVGVSKVKTTASLSSKATTSNRPEMLRRSPSRYDASDMLNISA